MQWSSVLNVKLDPKTLFLVSELVIINRWKDETIRLLSSASTAVRVPAFVARSPQRFNDNFYNRASTRLLSPSR